MTNLASDRSIDQATGAVATVPVYASAEIHGGAMVCALTSGGYAVKAGTASTGPVLGVAINRVVGGAASGDTRVELLQGKFWRTNYSTHSVLESHIKQPCYAVDDQTVSSDETDGPFAGIVLAVDSTLGVLFSCGVEIAAAFAGLPVNAIVEGYLNVQNGDATPSHQPTTGSVRLGGTDPSVVARKLAWGADSPGLAYNTASDRWTVGDGDADVLLDAPTVTAGDGTGLVTLDGTTIDLDAPAVTCGDGTGVVTLDGTSTVLDAPIATVGDGTGVATVAGTQVALKVGAVQYGSLTSTSLVVGGPDANYAMVLGQDGLNTAVRTFTIRGADNAGVGGKGTHVRFEPGSGPLAADDGQVQFYNGRNAVRLIVGESNYFYGVQIVYGPIWSTSGVLAQAPALSLLLGEDSTTAASAISTGLIRGGDHTFAGASGVNLTLRPGLGGAGGTDGAIDVQNAAGVTVVGTVLPDTTYVRGSSVNLSAGAAAGAIRFTVASSRNTSYNALCLRTSGADTALAGDSIFLGQDGSTAATAISTGLIRGGDHTFAGASGVHVTIRGGLGGAGGTTGVVTIQDAYGNAVWANDANGAVLSRGTRRGTATDAANPYALPDTVSKLIYTGAGGTVNLPGTPAEFREVYIFNATAGNITIGRSGNNINGAGADYTQATLTWAHCQWLAAYGWAIAT